MWKGELSTKVKFSLWHLLHDRIPTQTILFSRQIIRNPICNMCDSIDEDILHVLRDCEHIAVYWEEIITYPNFFLVDKETRLRLNLQNNKLVNGISWRFMFSFMYYEV